MSARHDLMAMNCCTAEQVSRFRTEVLRSVGELENELSAMQQRAEAAEARIKASQEQEPVGHYNKSGELTLWMGYDSETDIFVAPLIPPDVAELQRENADMKEECTALRMGWDEEIRENAELTRKLAEQQAKAIEARNLLQEFSKFLNGVEIAGKWMELKLHGDLQGGCWSLPDRCDAYLDQIDSKEELTKLLAEAKSQSVPEGFLPIETVRYWADAYAKSPYELSGGMIVKMVTEYAELRTMLAAAPQPPKEQEP